MKSIPPGADSSPVSSLDPHGTAPETRRSTAPAAPDRSTVADRAFLNAWRGWEGTTGPRLWDRIGPEWRNALLRAREAQVDLDPEAARDRLRREHAALAQPDLGRVHPSWWVRAIQQEPPSVQRAVTASLPTPLRAPLLAGLDLTPADLETDRPPHPEAVRSVLALWTERLIGDLPERPDDPPAIRAVTRLGPRRLVRLVRVCGLAKWTLAAGETVPRTGADRVRVGDFCRTFGPIDERVRALALRDLESVDRKDRHFQVTLGWLTLARLLSLANPYRVRWALQHLPYPIAKATRGLMPPPTRPNLRWLRWEEAVLRTAWDRLRAEGRLPDPGIAGAEA
jgi:hypothetical protein